MMMEDTKMGSATGETLRFEGCSMFRARVACSVLSSRPLRIDKIREFEEQPGLTDFEASYLRLVDKLTNGSKLVINETGTGLKFTPGFIVGGSVEHDCPTTRSIGWFLEGIIHLLPFAKKPTRIVFRGVTNDDMDASVDAFRTVFIPMLKRFGVEEGLDFKVKKRGAAPAGGGEVWFSCPIVRQLKTINLVDPGMVKRIRGVAYSTRVSPSMANRMVDSTRAICNAFLPDVYIHTDHYKGSEGGASPGFGICLVAESNTGCMIAAERVAGQGDMPEDVGTHAAHLLCEEIADGGCVDRSVQASYILFMVLCPEDVCKLRIGSLSDYSIDLLRLARQAFGVTFKIKADVAAKSVLLSCVGTGFRNMSKKVT